MQKYFQSAVAVAIVAFGCVDVVDEEYRDDGVKENRSDAGASVGHTDDECREVLVYRDEDGDGRGRGTYDEPEDGMIFDYCLGEDLPAGYAWYGYDCDDTDESAYALYPRDADGDGFGSKDESLSICAGVSPPEGYASHGWDCDDGDPNINLDAIDYWGDGLDTNCDGVDIPQDCDPDNLVNCQSCEEQLSVNDQGLATEPLCNDQPDLFVAELVECLDACDLTYHIRIGNRGLAPFDGDFILTVSGPTLYGQRPGVSEIGVYTISMQLQSGELSAPFSLPQHVGFLEISIDTGELTDCDVSNNLYKFQAWRYECFFFD